MQTTGVWVCRRGGKTTQGLGESWAHPDALLRLLPLCSLGSPLRGQDVSQVLLHSLLHQVRLSYKTCPKAVPLTFEPSASRPFEQARTSRQEQGRCRASCLPQRLEKELF